MESSGIIRSSWEEVCSLPNGCNLFRAKNEAGGYTYFTDEVVCGVMVWDTCLVDESTLLTAIAQEYGRRYKEAKKNKND